MSSRPSRSRHRRPSRSRHRRCTTCGTKTSRVYTECIMCYHIRGNMPQKHLIDNATTIHLHSVGGNMRGITHYTHQMCKVNNCRNPPDYSNFKDNQKKQGGNLSYEEWLKETEKKCYYCGSSPPNGIDRKNNKKGYHRNNILPCCSGCNYMKGRYTKSKFCRHIDKIHQYSIDN